VSLLRQKFAQPVSGKKDKNFSLEFPTNVDTNFHEYLSHFKRYYRHASEETGFLKPV